mgnify:CR=1 FL=1
MNPSRRGLLAGVIGLPIVAALGAGNRVRDLPPFESSGVLTSPAVAMPSDWKVTISTYRYAAFALDDIEVPS